jgi:farnesyl diphosphate synthase
LSIIDQSPFDEWVQARLKSIEAALALSIPMDAPAGLGQAIQYATLDGGKRLRPLLVLAACEATSGSEKAALLAACATELIHAYSLVHDDMPCMDNDQLRRGKPTVHVQFGQAQALLAGDAMQALAFEIITNASPYLIAPTLQAKLCGILARAAGHAGMAGGQALDLAHVGLTLNEQQLSHMHQLKTGALLQASIMMGAACGHTTSTSKIALEQYGQAIGLAYQVVDDILDATQSSKVLGKTAGKDAQQYKPTYVSVMGLDAARELAQALRQQAIKALHNSGLQHPLRLQQLADCMINRQH